MRFFDWIVPACSCRWHHPSHDNLKCDALPARENADDIVRVDSLRASIEGGPSQRLVTSVHSVEGGHSRATRFDLLTPRGQASGAAEALSSQRSQSSLSIALS